MQVIHLDINHIQPVAKNLGLCLGYFDGVHLGHRRLIQGAVLNNPGPVGVITFDHAPSVITKKHKSEKILTSIEDKMRIFAELKVDYLFVLKFDDALMKMDADTFILKVLYKLKPIRLYCGEDYRFGAHAAGNVNLLKKYFNVQVQTLQYEDNVKISSTNILFLIERDGNVEEANRLLGRNYEITGKVIHGKHKGEEIGYRTANLELETPYVLPKNGVYKTLCFVRGIPHLSLTNVGVHPTVGALSKPQIEVHIIDFDENIYGSTVYVQFLEYVRPEMTFESIEQLKRQIEMDLIVFGNKNN